MRPKKLDIFIIKSFLLLLAGTFFICLFILLMNILWRYIDVMVGKGLSFGILAKFFFNSALTLVPMALPLAVLLAALITFGNFGERYELLSMKTAGISLLRVMRPVTILCSFLALVSFFFQDVIVPNATKQLNLLAYSMYQKSPELDIPEGSFYDAITGYNLYVRHKDTTTGWLYDVTIYDVSGGFDDILVIAADSGRMETTADKLHLYLHLYSGEQFQNMEAQDRSGNSNPYRRETFREKHILIDFDSDFNMIDENLLNSMAGSKNMVALRHDIDSITVMQDSISRVNLAEYRGSALSNGFVLSSSDSVLAVEVAETAVDIDSIYRLASTSSQLSYLNSVERRVQTQISDLSFKGISMSQGDKNIRLHWIEWMKKFSFCLSVLIFFFIGAPLGAIIRKGGLGIPVVVSVCTFILYYITSTSGEKMFREGSWSIMGCWLSTFVLLPLSVFFTVSANKDSTVFEWDVYKEFFRHWFGGRVKRNIVYKDVVIEDPDMEYCTGLNASINSRSSRIVADRPVWKLPDYIGLFFRESESDEVNRLSEDVERLVEVLANSHDRVMLDLLNGFPVMPVYGIGQPFGNRTANAVIGVIFPVGLVFWLRAWLFSIKITRQVSDVARISGQMKCYIETGQLE